MDVVIVSNVYACGRGAKEFEISGFEILERDEEARLSFRNMVTGIPLGSSLAPPVRSATCPGVAILEPKKRNASLRAIFSVGVGAGDERKVFSALQSEVHARWFGSTRNVAVRPAAR